LHTFSYSIHNLLH
jgi:hypothetical protein